MTDRRKILAFIFYYIQSRMEGKSMNIGYDENILLWETPLFSCI